MKKFVLSAVITGLLGPLACAMDGGGAPPVEVELPEVAAPAAEAAVLGVEVPEVEVPEVEFVGDPIEVDLPVDSGFPAPEHGNAVEHVPPEGPGLGGEITQQIGESGKPDSVGVVPEARLRLVDGDDDSPQIYSALSSSTEIQPQAAEQRSDVGTSIREMLGGGLLPNFRSGVTDRGPEIPAARSVGEAHAANPQRINEGQRGAERSAEHRAERSLRSDDESTAPRSGIGRFFAKFHRPESEVTPASAPGIDKALTSQLAGIDRLRDTALRSGDQKLLAKADKLEQELRARSGQGTRIPTRTR